MRIFSWDILSLCDSIEENGLTLNSSKCCYVVFSKKRNVLQAAIPLYDNNNRILVRQNQYKYLGINFSADLSWSLHIREIAKKARK